MLAGVWPEPEVYRPPIQERASFTKKGKFTEPEHSVFGTAVEVSNIHEIVSGFGHEPDDFRD